MILLVGQIDSLIGNWKSSITNNVWECIKKSSTELSCGNSLVQNKVTFFGRTVTWESTGTYGIYDGNNTIRWRSGKWIREGRLILLITQYQI